MIFYSNSETETTMKVKNVATIVIALLFILLLSHYVTQRQIVYDLTAIQGFTYQDPQSFHHINTKSDSESNNINRDPVEPYQTDDVSDLDVEMHPNVDEDSTKDNDESLDVSNPNSIDVITNSDYTQIHITYNVDENDDHAKSDLDSAKKATLSDDPQVITTITPPSQVLFPYPKITHQPHEILNSPWATKMKAKLEAVIIGKQLTFLTASLNYLPILINWLIHAKLNALPLMENLLVVCVDKQCHEILSRKGIVSQLVQVTDIIYSMKDMDDNKVFSARVITRLTVLRLLNYWGYDVLVMDIDALLINNIQPIFDHFSDSDIIVSTANAQNCIPSAARNAWGFCLCIGLLLIRSNTNTGK